MYQWTYFKDCVLYDKWYYSKHWCVLVRKPTCFWTEIFIPTCWECWKITVDLWKILPSYFYSFSGRNLHPTTDLCNGTKTSAGTPIHSNYVKEIQLQSSMDNQLRPSLKWLPHSPTSPSAYTNSHILWWLSSTRLLSDKTPARKS
jgi:hypothetical protein